MAPIMAVPIRVRPSAAATTGVAQWMAAPFATVFTAVQSRPRTMPSASVKWII